MFGFAEIALTAVIAARWRSSAAYAALAALVATKALWLLSVPDAGAYASGVWCAAGAWLIYQSLKHEGIPQNGELLAGVFCGISGVVYIGYYLGAEHETLAFIPVISDISFGIGIIAGTWPGAFTWLGGGGGRAIHGSAVKIARADLARSALRNRGE